MIALSMMSSGCATTPPQVEAPDNDGACDASKAQALVGREATRAAGQDALRLTGARTIRWIPKGAAVTMDYRSDRLNLHLDRSNRITAIACG